MIFPGIPKVTIEYGAISKEDRLNVISWVSNMIKLYKEIPMEDRKEVSRIIVDELLQLGYSEGYDACLYDHEEEY